MSWMMENINQYVNHCTPRAHKSDEASVKYTQLSSIGIWSVLSSVGEGGGGCGATWWVNAVLITSLRNVGGATGRSGGKAYEMVILCAGSLQRLDCDVRRVREAYEVPMHE